MSGPRGMDETPFGFLDHEIMSGILYDMDPATVKTEPYLETEHGPYIQIIEEPKQRGFRFRYKCEGPSHGGLPGASSEKNKKTYPTVKVYNHVGHARIEVQLVTHTDPPRVHAHSLVGKNCDDSGTCSVIVGPKDLTAQFNNLSILHVTKKGVVEVLTERLRKERMRKKCGSGQLTSAEEREVLNEAKELGKSMDLNVVRLKFTAYLQDSQACYTLSLKPVFSCLIFDSKSPHASNLKITRMDKTCGSVLGGEEIFLLCDKVQKDDIEIRFYEEEEEDAWEAFGCFSPTDVHKQYAIVFKTPRYHSTEIERSVQVFLQLRRKNGGDCSEPKQFTYVPQVHDKDEVMRKKLKPLPHMYDHWRGPPGGASGQGRGAGGLGGGGAGDDRGFQFNTQMDGGSYFGQFGSGFGGGGAQMSEMPPPQESLANQQQANGTPQTQQQFRQIATALQGQANQTAQRTAGALLSYCRTGDVRLLLAVQRHLCTVQDENGDTSLHLAIIHQQPAVVGQVVHTLLRFPQQRVLDTRNHLGQSPLHLAVVTRQHKVVDFLLRAGADPTLVDRDGRSVVHLAAALGDEVTLRILLTRLGERHAHLFNMADYSGLFPLHLAVRKGGEPCLRVLVEGGAEINAVDYKSGCSALHFAVKENLLNVACVLLTKLKADVNARTFGGNTPLHLAACQGLPTLCSVLIAAGAQKNLENDEPLFLSSSSSSSSSCEEEDEDAEGEKDTCPSADLHPDLEPSDGRRRLVHGHTPFDLAKSQKVRNMLDCTQIPTPRSRTQTPKKEEEDVPLMDSETLGKLSEILGQQGVCWRRLAEKLGLRTLAHLFQQSLSPCKSLLENYKLGGGRVEGLVEALQSLGLNEGVQLLRQRELIDKIQTTDSTVDSGFGSQSIEELSEGKGDAHFGQVLTNEAHLA
ncbi:nuclear factor NF-kappa-B p100 subunit-like isoform X1 [Conger conger]|uniref:nuclear factor NF-kappa-B p100 subunit-like isoform X1 n=2 Tax=Conger conger TaxID=82655 RepID=UPI002A59FB70|nr:nuclear factor NF-kappa-B p100 subunit-like isoform X1 [Conger conger]XP_061086919.1 nuclear factor NF-kappa-B p100 subunit-like isoform X1 [Conger conger]